jgi:hypothetical protein
MVLLQLLTDAVKEAEKLCQKCLDMNWLGRFFKSRKSAVQHAQHGTAERGTAQHSTAQHSTAQHSTAQHSTAQHSTAQHRLSTSAAMMVCISGMHYALCMHIAHIACWCIALWVVFPREPRMVPVGSPGMCHATQTACCAALIFAGEMSRSLDCIINRLQLATACVSIQQNQALHQELVSFNTPQVGRITACPCCIKENTTQLTVHLRIS